MRLGWSDSLAQSYCPLSPVSTLWEFVFSVRVKATSLSLQRVIVLISHKMIFDNSDSRISLT